MQWIDWRADVQERLPDGALLPHYYEALCALFRVENALRMVVYLVLKNAYKARWATLNIESDDAAQGTIDSIARKRQSQELDYGYLDHPVTCPLMYLTSGEIIRLMLSEKIWPLFKPHFAAAKPIVQSKLFEIGNVRNRLAHFRPLKPADVSLVKQNATHVLASIEASLLNQLGGTTNVVPTNSTDAWYVAIRGLQSPNAQIQCFQSPDEHWIRLVLKYNCPVLTGTTTYSSITSYRVGVLSTPLLLAAHAELAHVLLFASEWVLSEFDAEASEAHFTKIVRAFFSRETLGSETERIVAALTRALAQIDEETSLLRNDHLARGQIIRPAAARVIRREDKEKKGVFSHVFATENLLEPVQPCHPPEYWDTFGTFVPTDFVSSTPVYPWMPVEFCVQEDIPF